MSRPTRCWRPPRCWGLARAMPRTLSSPTSICPNVRSARSPPYAFFGLWGQGRGSTWSARSSTLPARAGAVSESGRLRQGTGGPPGRRPPRAQVLVLTILSTPSTPLLLVLTPVALVGRLVPLTSIGCTPLRRRFTTPPLPVRRGRRIVTDRDLENRHGNVRGLDDRPWTAPAGPHIPTAIGEGPVLVGVEEDVGR